MTYAMGRLLTTDDTPFSNDIGLSLDPALTTLDELLERVVLSPAFRMSSVAAAQN
jgi:hypothetical protein